MFFQRSFYKSINFWIISVIFGVSLFYAALSEIFPIDWFMTSRPFRSNPDFIYKKNATRLLIAPQANNYFSYEPYFKDPDLLFEKTDHIFKDRKNRNKVALVEIEGVHYVVKKFKITGFNNWIKSFPFRASKAFRSWQYANYLTELNIPTPKPLMLIEKRVGPFWTDSYLVCEYLNGQTGKEYFSKDSPFKEHWKDSLNELKSLLEVLNAHQIIHADFSLNNIIVHERKIYLLDLSSLHLYHFDHAFYKRRYRNQHLEKLKRKFEELDSKASLLYKDIFSFSDPDFQY